MLFIQHLQFSVYLFSHLSQHLTTTAEENGGISRNMHPEIPVAEIPTVCNPTQRLVIS